MAGGPSREDTAEIDSFSILEIHFCGWGVEGQSWLSLSFSHTSSPVKLAIGQSSSSYSHNEGLAGSA